MRWQIAARLCPLIFPWKTCLTFLCLPGTAIFLTGPKGQAGKIVSSEGDSSMAKTVITAPHKPARPAHKPAPARQPQPQEETAPPAPAEALSEAEQITERLRDGLSGVESKSAEHRAELDRIAADLAALPGWVEAAEAHLAALQQEQAQLPRK